MRVLVIGAGATGGFYGGRLVLAGRDVTFLVREKRRQQLEQTGLVLRTPEGEFSLAPKLISAEELKTAGAFDLILLGVKAYAFDSAVEDFAPAVGPETMILPLLNGMRHLDALDKRFTPHNVLGGLCRILGDMDAEGRIIQMTPLSDVAYGERSRERTPRIEQVDATMTHAGFKAFLSPDILAAMWAKWMMMASVGSINALSRGSVGAVEAVHDLDHAGTRFATSVMNEAIAVATEYGHPPDKEALAMLHGRLLEPGSSFESSMYRDLTRGFPVEADQIVGDMVRRARLHGIATPLLEAAFVQLRVYENRRVQA